MFDKTTNSQALNEINACQCRFLNSNLINLCDTDLEGLHITLLFSFPFCSSPFDECVVTCCLRFTHFPRQEPFSAMRANLGKVQKVPNSFFARKAYWCDKHQLQNANVGRKRDKNISFIAHVVGCTSQIWDEIRTGIHDPPPPPRMQKGLHVCSHFLRKICQDCPGNGDFFFFFFFFFGGGLIFFWFFFFFFFFFFFLGGVKNNGYQ